MENPRNHSFLWKTPTEAAERPTGAATARAGARGGHPEAESPARGNLTVNTRGWLAYSLMSRSCAGGIRGGDGDTTSPPITVS